MSASSGRTPQVMEALANAERTSQRVLDELRRSVADAEDNLAEADMQLRRSMADAAEVPPEMAAMTATLVSTALAILMAGR